MAEDDRDQRKRSNEGRNRDESIPPATHAKYDEGLVKRVLDQGEFTTWDQVIEWLDTEGHEAAELTPREATAISTDFKRLEHRGEEFTTDPRRLLQMLQRRL